MDARITFTLNGRSRTVTTDPDRLLLEVLREDLHLTGTKYGCGEGECRACTVLVNGEGTPSCLTSIGSVDKQTVLTIEGLADGDTLHPVQEAFLAEGAFQCGYCTSGMILGVASVMKKNPAALSIADVGKGIFYSRPKDGQEENVMLALRKEYEATGGKFVEHDGPAELFPGAWLTGPVPRPYPERNWSVTGKVQTPAGLVEDNIPEDQSLVLNTNKGLIVVSGCGHAGVVNTLTFAEKEFPSTPVYALVGGFHLFAATDEQLDWTADKLKGFGVSYLIGAHCTGIEAVYRIREKLDLPRQSAVVGAVGATFVLGEGIHPGKIAQ